MEEVYKIVLSVLGTDSLLIKSATKYYDIQNLINEHEELIKYLSNRLYLPVEEVRNLKEIDLNKNIVEIILDYFNKDTKEATGVLIASSRESTLKNLNLNYNFYENEQDYYSHLKEKTKDFYNDYFYFRNYEVLIFKGYKNKKAIERVEDIDSWNIYSYNELSNNELREIFDSDKYKKRYTYNKITEVTNELW